MVTKSGSPWHTVDSLWLSNGKTDGKATLQLRVSFERPAKKKTQPKVEPAGPKPPNTHSTRK